MICFLFPFFTFSLSIRDERQKELKKLQATSKEEMWLHDLDEFVAKLDEVEAKENQETKDNQETQQKGFKKVGKPLMFSFVKTLTPFRWLARREW